MRRAAKAEIETVLKALADPTRRGLFERLTRDGEQTVHALTQAGSISQPMVSKHLAALQRARLVRGCRRGRESHYSAQPKALLPLVHWMTHYATFWNARFDRLEDLLNKIE